MVIPTSMTSSQFLAPHPTSFFMALRDVAFWIRSARADAKVARWRTQYGSPSAFDRLYAEASDPYGAELPQYRYQQRKYQSLLAMLPKRPYPSVLDIGCGLGAFTRQLAPFAQQVLGTDISGEVIIQARALSNEFANVRYEHSDVFAQAEAKSSFDLIVLADILYYIEPMTDAQLTQLAASLHSSLSRGGLLLLVNHFFFGFDGASKRTRAIHDVFQKTSRFSRVLERRHPFFLATLLEKSS